MEPYMSKTKTVDTAKSEPKQSRLGFAIVFKFPHFALQYLDLFDDNTYLVKHTDDTGPITNVFTRFKKAVTTHFGI